MYGNVIDIELGEDEDETVQRNRDNETYELDHTPLDENLMNWVQLGTNHKPPRSDGNSVVQGGFIKFCLTIRSDHTR
jgi:hypothetical protein